MRLSGKYASLDLHFVENRIIMLSVGVVPNHFK